MPGKVATGLESLAVPISQHPGTLSSLLPVAPAGMKLLCWPPHPLQAGAAHSRVSWLHRLQRAGGTSLPYGLEVPEIKREDRGPGI